MFLKTKKGERNRKALLCYTHSSQITANIIRRLTLRIRWAYGRNTLAVYVDLSLHQGTNGIAVGRWGRDGKEATKHRKNIKN